MFVCPSVHHFPVCSLLMCKGCLWFSLSVELDLGLKKDSLSSDGSSLEALLKGEPLDKRVPPELRGPEEESSLTDYTGGAVTPAARIRKVT